MALENFRTRFGKAMMELVGTGLLVLIVQVTIASGSPGAPLAIGLGLAFIVYAAGPVSGGHVNPAVSLAVFLRGKMTLHEMLMYWLFQLIGGIAGAVLGGIIAGQFFDLKIGEGYHFLQAFLAEFVFTSILCFVVLAVATNSKAEGNSYYGLAIGLVVFVGALGTGAISGGAFNPAVAVGLVLAGGWNIVYLGWVVLADLLGAFAAAAVFYIVAPDEFGHFSEEAHNLVDEARSLLPGQTAV